MNHLGSIMMLAAMLLALTSCGKSVTTGITDKETTNQLSSTEEPANADASPYFEITNVWSPTKVSFEIGAPGIATMRKSPASKSGNMFLAVELNSSSTAKISLKGESIAITDTSGGRYLPIAMDRSSSVNYRPHGDWVFCSWEAEKAQREITLDNREDKLLLIYQLPRASRGLQLSAVGFEPISIEAMPNKDGAKEGNRPRDEASSLSADRAQMTLDQWANATFTSELQEFSEKPGNRRPLQVKQGYTVKVNSIEDVPGIKKEKRTEARISLHSVPIHTRDLGYPGLPNSPEPSLYSGDGFAVFERNSSDRWFLVSVVAYKGMRWLGTYEQLGWNEVARWDNIGIEVK